MALIVFAVLIALAVDAGWDIKGQIWLYLRQMGLTPPFYAMPLPLGERPDIAARQRLGGF